MGKSTFFADFKKFITKGNIIDMATGVIIGQAFGKIVTSLVNDIIMPPIGLLLGKVNFADLKWVLQPEVIDTATNEVTKAAVSINYGNFIQLIIDFLIVAFVIFLVLRSIIKAQAFAEKLKKKEEEVAAAAAPAPQPSEEVLLLREIRDSLNKK